MNIMKYIKRREIVSYLKDKDYCSISYTGSIIGMKKFYGWKLEVQKRSYFRKQKRLLKENYDL